MKLLTYLSSIFFLLITATTIDAQTERPIASQTKGTPINSSSEAKSVAPAFSLTSLDGKNFALASLRGKIVVLNFWFTGCVPCLTEIPKLNELVEKFKSDEVVFIAPTWDKEDIVLDFLKEHPFKYNIVTNADDLIIHTYGDGKGNVLFPTHIVIDKQGNIDTKIVGGLKKVGSAPGLDDLTKAIERLTKKSPEKITVKGN